MVKSFLARGTFYWLRAPRNNDDVRLDEWILAIARLVLSACYLGALVRADSTLMLMALILLYLVYSLLIILMLRSYSHLSPAVYFGIHCADILWATTVVVLGSWPAMSLVAILFVISSTAIRWGFWEAVFTAAFFCVALLIGSSVSDKSIEQLWYYGDISNFVLEALFFIIIVCLVGFLSEAKASRSEGNFMTRALEDIRLETGLEEALRIICAHALHLYGPTQVLLVMLNRDENKCHLYRLSRFQETLQYSTLDSSQRKRYFFQAPAECWRLAISHPHGKNRFTCLMLKAGKKRKQKSRGGLPDSFLTAHPFSLMLAASHVYESGWAVRFYMLNPNRFVAGIAGLRFMERSLRQLAPLIHDAFLVDRLTTRAIAAASKGVARELHDGVIQSLSSIHMQLEEIRLQAAPMAAGAADRIARIQKSIHEEIAGLRDFTHQLRSMELDSGHLLAFLSGMAMKFQTEHGIATKFISEVEEVALRPNVCVELARIVQEALANIRKHSGADKANIFLDRRDGQWLLSITDNGCGFDFSGRRDHEELQSSGKGPLVLMERARAIRGSVAIRSREGDGTCLEITFP